MHWPIIEKPLPPHGPAPNLSDYYEARRDFSWETVRRELDLDPKASSVNIAHLAVDRHARSHRKDVTALRWLGRDGTVRDYSYGDLSRLSNRFANVLQKLGIGRGDRVFVLAGRIPELYIAALGTLKNGSVFCPLFSAFGPEPISARMNIGQGRVLLTTDLLYGRKVAGIRDSLQSLEQIITVSDGGRHDPRNRNYHDLMSEAGDEFTVAPTGAEDMALLHFTSGTTGKPKGAVHVHGAVPMHYLTGRLALDLHPDDVFWCTADPGWVTGTSYGIISPLVNGVTSIVYEDEFDPQHWYRTLQDQKVTVWYTAPTAIRMLMKAGAEAAREVDLSHLRFLASVGEPLNPEAVVWGRETLGLPFHDNWWQTETGGIMIANYATSPIRPGSMGRPLPGVEAAIVRRTAEGVQVVESADVEGELALRAGWPSMFRGYLHEEERYQKCFADGWYLSGDLARQDSDGYFWFVGRADDVIKSAGHLIGPFEVESVLMEHPAVAEAGVIGKPDPVALEVVKAFVALKPDYQPGEGLRKELLALARKRLGAAVAPREIDFQASLPKTRSGKIMRRLLKARELGLPEGDLSTLEEER